MATSILVKVPVGLLIIVVVVSVSAVVTGCLFTVILGIPLGVTLGVPLGVTLVTVTLGPGVPWPEPLEQLAVSLAQAHARVRAHELITHLSSARAGNLGTVNSRTVTASTGSYFNSIVMVFHMSLVETYCWLLYRPLSGFTLWSIKSRKIFHSHRKYLYLTTE